MKDISILSMMALFKSPESMYSMRFFDDLKMDLDDYQKSIIIKASSLNGDPSEALRIRRSKSSSPKQAQNSATEKRTPTKKEDSLIESAERARMKLLHELELTRQQDIKDKIEHRMERWEQAERAIREEMLLQHEIAMRENYARIQREENSILQQLRNEELQSNRRHEQVANAHRMHAKRVHELSQMISEAEQRQREAEEEERRRLMEKKLQLDKIHQYQVEYRTKYQKILDVIKTCKDRPALTTLLSNHIAKIKNLDEAMDQLMKQCKVGEISNLDLQTAANFVQQIEEVANLAQTEAEKINERCNKDEAAKQEAENARKKAAEEQRVQQVGSSDPNASPKLNTVVDKEVAKDYMALQKFHEEFATSYADLLKDDRMKKFRFDCQKAINIPVNSISAVSPSHMQDKLNKLSRLLSGQSVEVSQGHFSASAHPQGIPFCKNLMAKKFVDQGSTVVSSKPEAAFAFAAIAVSLWVDFPDFGQLLLAHFYNACPYLVPIFLPQLEGQSDQDYYKSLGYNYSESGEVEKQDKFLKRMSGIMRLYAAIFITSLRRGQTKPHPHGLKQGWRWIACMLNAEPQPDICASLLFDFLEVAGNAMFTNYGIQFQKLLHLICKEYFPRIEKITPIESKGPVTRLENFLQTIIKQGRIPPFDGQLPANFW